MRYLERSLPQGLKPFYLFDCFGTAEAVPFRRTVALCAMENASRSYKRRFLSLFGMTNSDKVGDTQSRFARWTHCVRSQSRFLASLGMTGGGREVKFCGEI
jgi:hypothetical protein